MEEERRTPKTVKDYLGPMRVPFLLLPPVCVLLGVATAYWSMGRVNWWYAFLAFLGALSSHVSVNAFNEYMDFKSGLDAKTQRTPFSGGSGTLVAHPELAGWTLFIACFSLAIPVVIGFYFLKVWGWAIVPLGLVGLLLVVAYTGWITRRPLLCLMAPGLGFGVLWVMGTYFVLTGHYSLSSFFASLVLFFLVSDLLLLNQFPDTRADVTVGRRHLVIVKGEGYSARVYVAFLVLAYLSLVLGVELGVLPKWALLGLATLVLAVPTATRVLRYAEDLKRLMPALGKNVLINLLTPFLTAVGLFLARWMG